MCVFVRLIYRRFKDVADLPVQAVFLERLTILYVIQLCATALSLQVSLSRHPHYLSDKS